MQRIAIVAIIATLGMVSAFGVSQLTNQAGAAPPCSPNPNPPRCTPTPTATATPTPTATPAPTPTPSPIPIVRAREDQITIFSQANVPPGIETGSEYRGLKNAASPVIALDPSDYPSSSSFRFEAEFNPGSPGFPATQTCVALFDSTASGVVPGSELCGPGGRQRSGAFGLPLGEHEYLVVAKCELITASDCQFGSVTAGRIIAEWTELGP